MFYIASTPNNLETLWLKILYCLVNPLALSMCTSSSSTTTKLLPSYFRTISNNVMAGVLSSVVEAMLNLFKMDL